MSNGHSQDRGKLFANAQKLKPSQPDFQGECTLDGTPYEIRAWRREDQLTISLAPPRGDRNTYPPDVFRGALEAAPPKPPVRGKDKDRGAAKEVVATAAFTGDITSDEAAYSISAFEKQGKHGVYYTLSFARLENPIGKPATEWGSPDDDE